MKQIKTNCMTTIAGVPRKYLLINIMLMTGVFVFAQPSNKPAAVTQAPAATGTVATHPSDYISGIKVNYVRSWDAMGAYQDPNTMMTAGYQHSKEATQYFDGLGRPLQTVARQAGPGPVLDRKSVV